MTGLTIKSGKAQAGNLSGDGGGLYNANGRVTLNQVRVYTNTAFSRGGGIFNMGELIVTNNSLIEANTAETAGGGGISNLNGRVSVLGSSLTGNHADDTIHGVGGGLGSGSGLSNVVMIASSVINHNVAGNEGGGLWTFGGVMTITDAEISDNLGGESGGGLYALVSAQLLIISTGFYDNVADLGGGVMLLNNTTAVLTTTVFSSNQAQQGGGVALFNRSRLTGKDVTLLGNSATESGGGLALYVTSTVTLDDGYTMSNSANSADGGGLAVNTGSHVTMTNHSIAGNLAARNGGGLYLNGATATVSNSAIYSNSAQTGGGFYFWESNSTISNSTISHNHVWDLGGGVYQGGGLAATLSQSTVADNSAYGEISLTGSGGGVYIVPTGTLDMQNTLLANNIAYVGGGMDCNGPITSQDYNLVENTTGCFFGGTLTHNVTGVDPKLGPLADNGGGTLTHALLSGSPARDKIPANLCPATDQRGVKRPQGAACDIGAFEAQFKIYLPLILR